ncbi:thioredoxin family protein [Leptolyngbya sp. NIES-2104]|uniref:thioredoxin family protein n=1 Tax=Leptolyngbya sp. NIES-2104 TaxID=1552121 RepID=UPI0006EC9949|nr:thioredoxin family protein [Leptolyngbya sp. NIES-2104]GAP95330.1 alkyl hydroperoxide reductase and/or thiol-specific antioxidant family (AhpC/TSA) protein [Leptolyngbya sp. NIES-2104]
MDSPLIGKYAPDFEIPGADGAIHHLARYLERHRAIAVVFMCNHCPYVKLYLDRLKQLQTELQSQGMTLIGINPNDEKQFPEDSYEKMQSFVTEHQLNFLYLRDMNQDVAHSFNAEKTPHVFLLDQKGIVQYAGAIDDNAQDATAVKTPYLKNAIAALLNDDAIAPVSTAPVGCSIKWRD